MSLSSAEIKRQILKSSDESGIRKRIQSNSGGLTEGDIIEMGNALEQTTKGKGWVYIESFMLRKMNIVGLVFDEKENSPQKGIARGYIELMQYIDQMIKAKEAILAKEKGTPDVPPDVSEEI